MKTTQKDSIDEKIERTLVLTRKEWLYLLDHLKEWPYLEEIVSTALIK
jgi:hypothetical protein